MVHALTTTRQKGTSDQISTELSILKEIKVQYFDVFLFHKIN